MFFAIHCLRRKDGTYARHASAFAKHQTNRSRIPCRRQNSARPSAIWPCFYGTRVPIKNLFDSLAAGETMEAFLDGFEGVSREQALAVLDLASNDLLDELGRLSTPVAIYFGISPSCDGAATGPISDRSATRWKAFMCRSLMVALPTSERPTRIAPSRAK